MDHMKFETPDLVEENIEKIKALFPSVMTEGTDENGNIKEVINFEVLKQLLSKDVIDGDECYEFTWVGKKAAMAEAAKPTTKTLRPVKEDSKDWDNTENLYIEGDNLEVLKILQESYLGKVKMIYIDPPYNTGHDFIYPDSYMMDEEDYAAGTGYFDENGYVNFTRENTTSAGKYHSDWCSMMYARLTLAKNILSQDGMILISIGQTELENTLKICDEIFGETNRAGICSRQMKTGNNQGKYFTQNTDYIVAYVKDDWLATPLKDDMSQELIDKVYNKIQEAGPRKGQRYRTMGLFQASLKHGGSQYPIECPDGSQVITPNGLPWRWNQATFLKGKANDEVVFIESNNSPLLDAKTGLKAKWNIYTKIWLNDRMDAGQLPSDLILKFENRHAAKELLAMDILFDFPKPTTLIKYLLHLVPEKEYTVLDFFSGSATTADSVMQLNAEDGGKRKFIMVQLPEPCGEKTEAKKARYDTICEIGKERIRRAGDKIKAENPLGTQDLDIGFRVFRIDDSNMKDVYYHPEELDQLSLNDMISNIKEDRTDMDLLYSCLLDWGVEINLPHTTTILDGCTIHNVDNGALMACFNEKVPASVIQYMAKQQPLRAVFRDSCFAADDAKINVEETFKNFSPDTSVRVL